jgi:hypothetical protein
MVDAEVAKEVGLRRELLRFVLHDTLKKTGVPAQWIGGEATPLLHDSGELSIEIRLILECDEPRFLYYLAAFQAEFEDRLLAIDPRAWDWVSRITWSLGTHREEGDPEFRMPPPDYWSHVVNDREITARQQGRKEWDQETLARHFEDTDPGHADFENTHPPDRDEEDLHPSKF